MSWCPCPSSDSPAASCSLLHVASLGAVLGFGAVRRRGARGACSGAAEPWGAAGDALGGDTALGVRDHGPPSWRWGDDGELGGSHSSGGSGWTRGRAPSPGGTCSPGTGPQGGMSLPFREVLGLVGQAAVWWWERLDQRPPKATSTTTLAAFGSRPGVRPGPWSCSSAGLGDGGTRATPSCRGGLRGSSGECSCGASPALRSPFCQRSCRCRQARSCPAPGTTGRRNLGVLLIDGELGGAEAPRPGALVGFGLSINLVSESVRALGGNLSHVGMGSKRRNWEEP